MKGVAELLTEPPLVLDSDFLSSYSWVDRLDVLEKLYAGRMVILDEVMEEINRVPHLAEKVITSITNGSIQRVSMIAASAEALELAKYLEDGKYGRGESACMAYLKHNDGSLGSNNLADIKKFCVDTNKRLITTGDALYQALKSGIITLNEGDAIWTRMLDKRRKLPTDSFSEYLSKYQSAS